VQIPDTGIKYVTNLRTRECEYTYFWEYCLLCTYAITALRYEGKDPYLHFDKCYQTRKLYKTYKRFLKPVSIQDLPSLIGCLPPEYKKQPGRPRTKRFQKGESKRKATKCGNCGQRTRHNRRTCQNAPQNTRRERAQNRGFITSLSASSTSSLDSRLRANDDNDSDLDSLNSELLREQQWQAEMERYDFIVARGHAIVERMRQEELQDNDIVATQSDSELSDLASSLFNGMEGIESGETKMGEQGDDVDSQGDVIGTGIGTRIAIETSPRRTRSGKVVEYHK
jgi:hypothetical protein